MPCLVNLAVNRILRLNLIVHLSSAPLLWDGLVLVQDVSGHVIQVLVRLNGLMANNGRQMKTTMILA